MYEPSSGSAAPEQQTRTQVTPRILVVDDLVTMRDIGHALLTRAGFSVDLAVDGAKALELASTRRYSLILMDVNMPTLDGISATRLIRDRAGPNQITPIVAMTAEGAPMQIQNVLDAGMDGHLCKPFRPAELFETVNAWVNADHHA